MPAKASLYQGKFFQVVLVLVGVSIILLSIIGDKGFIALETIQEREQQLVKEVEELSLQQKEWQYKIEMLSTKEKYFDTLAREELGMIKKNEQLILLSPQ